MFFSIPLRCNLKQSMKCSNYAMEKYLNNFINGNFIKGIGRSDITILSPHNNKKIGTIICSNENTVETAVSASKSAFKQFSLTSYSERSQILANIAKNIRENINILSYYETLDTGKVLSETRADCISAADCFEYYSACALTLKDDCIPIDTKSYALSVKEPLGVCVGIGAWNYPIANAAWKIAPALCMGNTMIFKPSQFTPISTCMLAELCTEAGLPKGVFNVVQGDGTTGENLCKHHDVSKVSFTGSVSSGKKVLVSCSDPIKRVTLELGGKSPLIIFEDAELENAIKGAISANYTIQGQVCSNATRVYVHDKIYQLFKERLIEVIKMIKVGNPFDEMNQSGAMISIEHFNKVAGFIERAKSNGAVVLYGGDQIILDDIELQYGRYMWPCLLENCTDDMEISKEEVFGPVMCIYRFKTEEEVIERANDTIYGLAAGLYSRDITRIHRVSRSLNASTIYVNTYNMYPINTPFGGRKQSGFGRENGLVALQNYYDLKTIIIETGDTPEPFT